MKKIKKPPKNVMSLLSNAQEGTMPPKMAAKGGRGIVTPNKVPSYPGNTSYVKGLKETLKKNIKKAD